MKPILTTLLLIMLFTACSRENELTLCPDPTSLPWLAEKQKEYNSCICETDFLMGSYEGRSIFEIRLVAPLCNGINVIYDEGGNVLFNSADKEKYEHFRSNAKNLSVFWSCTKPSGGQ